MLLLGSISDDLGVQQKSVPSTAKRACASHLGDTGFEIWSVVDFCGYVDWDWAMGFVMDKVTLGQAFSMYFGSPASFYSTSCSIFFVVLPSTIYNPDTDSVVI
jgi:hypothetical protein